MKVNLKERWQLSQEDKLSNEDDFSEFATALLHPETPWYQNYTRVALLDSADEAPCFFRKMPTLASDNESQVAAHIFSALSGVRQPISLDACKMVTSWISNIELSRPFTVRAQTNDAIYDSAAEEFLWLGTPRQSKAEDRLISIAPVHASKFKMLRRGWSS
jgi:hypothetical protein